jgi:hypothetical protein
MNLKRFIHLNAKFVMCYIPWSRIYTRISSIKMLHHVLFKSDIYPCRSAALYFFHIASIIFTFETSDQLSWGFSDNREKPSKVTIQRKTACVLCLFIYFSEPHYIISAMCLLTLGVRVCALFNDAFNCQDYTATKVNTVEYRQFDGNSTHFASNYRKAPNTWIATIRIYFKYI